MCVANEIFVVIMSVPRGLIYYVSLIICTPLSYMSHLWSIPYKGLEMWAAQVFSLYLENHPFIREGVRRRPIRDFVRLSTLDASRSGYI